MSLLLNILSRLVITFLPRSKCLLISWLQWPSAVILEPQKIKSDTVSTVSLALQSFPTLWLSELQPTWFLCPWNFFWQEYWRGCHFLLQGLNPSLPCRQVDCVKLNHLRIQMHDWLNQWPLDIELNLTPFYPPPRNQEDETKISAPQLQGWLHWQLALIHRSFPKFTY